MILCVNLNPCVDKTLFVPTLVKDVIQSASRVEVTVGGKANNVARVLSAFGRDVVAMNFLGGETGRLCHRLIETEDHVRAETIRTDAATREIVTIYEESVSRHTDIKEPGPRITDDEIRRFLDRYRELLPEAQMVSFGGSAPCPATDNLPAQLCREAAQAGIPFVLDTYGKALELALGERPFLVTPNIAEAEAALNERIRTDDTRRHALMHFAEYATITVLTLGEKGFLAHHDGKTYRVKAPVVETKNAVGSGDALVAGIVMGVLEKLPFDETLALAAAAGAANASKFVACRITPDDVDGLRSRAKVEQM